MKGSGKKCWFHCDECNHDFESSPNKNTNRNTWCPYCCKSVRKLCKGINCTYCYNNSFASYTGKTVNGKLKVECWHPTKNNNIVPRNKAISCITKFWFKCDICNHNFKSSPNKITSSNRWCPYCANKKLCKENDCNHCFNSSFASYTCKTANGMLKVECWHPTKNGDLTPRDIMKRSNKKYWFHCNDCNHDFESLLSNITKLNGTWCPYCANLKLCKENDCIHCFNNSFASYTGKTKSGKFKINCWHPTKNGGLTPRYIMKYTHKKYWFHCEKCNHNFESAISPITGQNCWCFHCVNKTELKLYNHLLALDIVINVKREYKPKWCSTVFIHINKKNEYKTGKYQYSYDFLVTLKNKNQIIIELDGPQHYKLITHFKRSPLEIQIRDKYKEFLAMRHNIPLIRYIQEDVYNDKNNWKQTLLNQLRKLLTT